MDASSDDRGYVGLENIESWTGRLIAADSSDKTSGGEAEAQGTATSFEVGDILFGKLRPYLAKAMLAENDGVCSTELLVLKPDKELNARFLFYVLLCPEFIALVDSSTFGAKMPRANWDFIGAMQVPDFSDASFQRASMCISGQYPMKVLHTQEVRIYTSIMGGKQERVRWRRVTSTPPTIPWLPGGLRCQTLP